MKILLVGNYLLSQQESMQRFSSIIEDGLLQAGHEVKVIRPKPFMCKSTHAEHGLNKWLGYIDRFILFRKPLIQASKWADVVHICDHSNAMYAKWLSKPTLVTCHDLMAIQSALGMNEINPTGLTGRLFQKWIVSGLKSCEHIACVSENTQKELLKTILFAKEKTSIAYNSLNYPYSPMNENKANDLIAKRLPQLNKPYVFHLGGNQWYKNRVGVAEIFAELIQHQEYEHHLLVLAGKSWPDDLHKKIKELGIRDKTFELIDLSNEEIRAFYSTCDAMLFPSLQEGFGWPIVEAQACGAIVITTNRTPMTEVGGDAAIYIEPEKQKQAAEIIASKLKESHDWHSLNDKNVKRFKLNVMIDSYIANYKNILI